MQIITLQLSVSGDHLDHEEIKDMALKDLTNLLDGTDYMGVNIIKVEDDYYTEK